MPAVLFGSISTLADTSELQRAAFNQAFRDHGLTWWWDREDYRATLDTNGGKARIASFAAELGEEVDAAAIHATKSKLFQESLADSEVKPRAGVAATVAAAKEHGIALGMVTTTSRDNVTALLDALAPTLGADVFDVVVDSADVDEPKPDAAAYRYALDKLGIAAAEAVAIEDNPGGVQSANAAGVVVVAFPNENTAGLDFSGARSTIDTVDLDVLQGLLGNTA